MIKLNEIFFSIQGESTYVGLPTVFIRTSGCHLRCTYCDTTYAYNDGDKISVEDIIDQVKEFSCNHVCLTGGEPLLQQDCYGLMAKLCDLGYSVSLETSGDIDCKDVDPRVKKIIDVKTPDSGEPKAFNKDNLQFADVNSEFKFVICSARDFDWAVDFASQHKLLTSSTVLFSPSFNEVTPQWLAEKILEKKLPIRLQLQLHKYIWSAEVRGV